MKYHLLQVITLCTCLGQICFATNDYIEGIINKIQKDVRENNNVGEQFVFDITKILQQSPKNPLCLEIFKNGLTKMLSHVPPKQNNEKIDVNGLKEFYSLKESYHHGAPGMDYIQKLDYYKIVASTLSKQLPAERYNGIINLYYIILYPNATPDEIANTLNYVYGTDNEAATKESYLDSHNFPEPVAKDCAAVNKFYSDIFEKLNSLTDIKPKVVQDLTSIREKFACNVYASNLLTAFVDFIAKIQDVGPNGYRADACMTLRFGARRNADASDKWEYDSLVNESILSQRLPNETFRGIIDVMRVIRVNTPMEEVEKALEYVYDNVPKIDCTTPEFAHE